MRIGFNVLLLTVLAGWSIQADTLEGTLNRLDQAGSQFKGMTAKFTYLKFTAVVSDKSTSEGTMKIKKIKRPQPPDDILGLLDFSEPDKKTVALDPKTVQIYLPKLNKVQIIDLGKHKGLIEQFFLFGFGTSKSDLLAAYDVSYGGAETINGEPTTHLVLISKNPEVRRQLSKFQLWISDKTGLPVRQEFDEPSGDYNVFTYRDMKMQNLPDSALAATNIPKNAKRENLK